MQDLADGAWHRFKPVLNRIFFSQFLWQRHAWNCLHKISTDFKYFALRLLNWFWLVLQCFQQSSYEHSCKMISLLKRRLWYVESVWSEYFKLYLYLSRFCISISFWSILIYRGWLLRSKNSPSHRLGQETVNQYFWDLFPFSSLTYSLIWAIFSSIGWLGFVLIHTINTSNCVIACDLMTGQ